uniref:Putative secreted protein n=1 Tax=Ixodes ricinus TaxID=34613 RepID=A0A6B0UR09_IXORI
MFLHSHKGWLGVVRLGGVFAVGARARVWHSWPGLLSGAESLQSDRLVGAIAFRDGLLGLFTFFGEFPVDCLLDAGASALHRTDRVVACSGAVTGTPSCWRSPGQRLEGRSSLTASPATAFPTMSA